MAGITAAELEVGLGEVRDRLNIVASATPPNATELFQAIVIAVERMMETSVRFAKHTEEMARQTADDVTAARLDNLTGITGIQSRVTNEVKQMNESLNKVVVHEAASRYNACVSLKAQYTQMINNMSAANAARTPHVKGIMEHRPVQGIKMLDDDKVNSGCGTRSL